MAILKDRFPPRLGFCGYSDSGKTTLIEKLIPALASAGLTAGYLKHDAHRLDVDREGKDTWRIYKAGASVVAANSEEETFARTSSVMDGSIFAGCDLVIVEGFKNAEWDKFWVHPYDGDSGNMPNLVNVIGEIGGGGFRHDDVTAIAGRVEEWLRGKVSDREIYGGLLIGGKSERMGSPKSLMVADGVTLAERNFALLKGHCDAAYLLGTGPVPENMKDEKRIADLPGVEGPLGGILSASRLASSVDWLILAVDMPNVTAEYLKVIIDSRGPGYRFIGAGKRGGGLLEPLCSLYSPQILHWMDSNRGEELSLNRLLKSYGVEGDESLFDGEILKNLNSPADL
ncbi:MAG: molybdopterin-guanine dinucleotide biosynthesis protein B [Nitrospinota bacterium]|nr:molybdopterin-guanine dinucleotide biosynthesis protein B [Nitrospinota bacterium]